MRRIVIVSGSPGAGKSTIAEPLADALRFALISKDVFKEALFDSLGPFEGDPLVWSRRLSSAAMELAWEQAARCPKAVVDANFRPRSEYERGRLEKLGPRLVEVYCSCPGQEAARRFAERARQTGHHATHALEELPAELLAEYGTPVGLGPVIEVDTTGPVAVADIATLVRAAFGRHVGGR